MSGHTRWEDLKARRAATGEHRHTWGEYADGAFHCPCGVALPERAPVTKEPWKRLGILTFNTEPVSLVERCGCSECQTRETFMRGITGRAQCLCGDYLTPQNSCDACGAKHLCNRHCFCEKPGR